MSEKRKISIHHTAESKNNSKVIAETEGFFVLVDDPFIKSKQAQDELIQAKTLGKPIYAIVHKDCISRIPPWVFEIKFESFEIISSEVLEPFVVSVMMKKIMQKKGANLQN